jgi:hypothetical protein
LGCSVSSAESWLGEDRAVRAPELVEKLLHPTTGVARGLLKTDSSDKLIKIRVGELREIDTALRQLNAECERAWRAYRIAHEQAMENGSRLQMLRLPAEQSSGMPKGGEL